MGYGLAVNVPVLVNQDRPFDVVVDHYRAFNLETGPVSGMDLMVYVPLQNSRFGTFLDLIQKLAFFADSETVLIVNHGMSDQDDNALGLILPLTAGSVWNPEEYTLGLLAGFVGKTPSDQDYTDGETQSTMEVQHRTVRMPPGTLKTLDTALRALRARKKLTRLEIRACNLGSNPKVMTLLARVLGVTTIVAPKVHMFYSKIGPPGPLPDSDTGFTTWQRNHQRSRTFTEAVASNPRRVGIQVNGKHSHRTTDFDTTNLDVTWFIEKFICPGSGYVARVPGRGARVNPLSFSGMDIGASFVLGQEDDYANKLVEVTP